MSPSQLLDSTFKRICIFAEKSGFKIRNVEGCVAFYFNSNSKLCNYVWRWKNKKDLMLGNKIDCDYENSLFSMLIYRYEYIKRHNIKNSEPISEPISENALNFINVCRFLNDCISFY